MRRDKSAAIAIVAALLASCSTQRPAAPPVPSRQVPTPTPATPSVSAASYVAIAASIDLYVVRASELALERTGNARVRELARAMAAEHRGLAAQLSLAGRRVNLLPGAQLRPREQARLDQLAAAVAFDELFRRQMVLTHQQSLALHAAFAARGLSPTLRPVATNAERVERAHLSQLRGR